ncbi:hypothetical protein PoB_006589100 [Plakobranchus ocellatus]|uniref:Apple domain-containing protein n=1 Tax=Plakobranchus ocellatus TaxID=259542 RepID=A0AAV4D5F0_9GAST|nr:hypothetical protein PoB_006589100 [Plakobranchus ocellatus]
MDPTRPTIHDCENDCLDEDTCEVVEERGSLCLWFTDRTVLVSGIGSTASVKICTTDMPSTTQAGDSDMPSTTQAEDSDISNTTEKEDNAHAAKPLLTLLALATVLAIQLGRRP